jgi:hypothetical protein
MKQGHVLLLIAGLLVVLLGLGAFSQVTAMSYNDLVAKLRAAGAVVVEQGAIAGDTGGLEPSAPLLRGTERILAVNGERVDVHEYATTFFAAADAARVSPDGSTFRAGVGPLGGSAVSVDWVTPPHFYRSGRLIVQYVGTRAEMTGLLAQILGPQFAGGPV